MSRYNCENGGPAPEKLTNKMVEWTAKITEIKSCSILIAMKIHNLCTNMIHFRFIVIMQHPILAYLGSQVQTMDSSLNNPKKIA